MSCHSRTRRWRETPSGNTRRNGCCQEHPAALKIVPERLTKARKSESLSSKRLCCSSAACFFLHGPLAILNAEGGGDHHHLAQATGLRRTLITIFARRGSRGCARAGDRSRSAAVSLRDRRWRAAPHRLQLFQEGQAVLDMARLRRLDERKASILPRPSASICRMTEARLVRRISGSVKAGRLLKSSSW